MNTAAQLLFIRRRNAEEEEPLKKTFHKIKLLSVATPQARKQLIAIGDKELINCVSECFVNILKGNVSLNEQQKTKLCKYKSNLRKIALKKVSLKKANHTNWWIPHRCYSSTCCISSSQLAFPLTWNMQKSISSRFAL